MQTLIFPISVYNLVLSVFLMSSESEIYTCLHKSTPGLNVEMGLVIFIILSFLQDHITRIVPLLISLLLH